MRFFCICLLSLVLIGCGTTKGKKLPVGPILTAEQYAQYKITEIVFKTDEAIIQSQLIEDQYAKSVGYEIFARPVALSGGSSYDEQQSYKNQLDGFNDYKANMNTPETKSGARALLNEVFTNEFSANDFNLQGEIPLTLHIDIRRYSVILETDATTGDRRPPVMKWEWGNANVFSKQAVGIASVLSLKTTNGDQIELYLPDGTYSDKAFLGFFERCRYCVVRRDDIMKWYETNLQILLGPPAQ